MSVDLEEFCVVQPYESAWRAPYDGKWHEIRPGYLRKVYPPSKKDRRIYGGAVLRSGDKIRPIEKIATLVDKRSLSELKEQAKNALMQMLYRAHCGDRDAMLEYILYTRAAVASVRTLANHRTVNVRAKAETFSDWPVLLSLNPQDIATAKQELTSLGVGTRSPLPTKPSQHWDRHNFWTQLAEQAVTACADNKRRVPALKAFCARTKPRRQTLKFWGTRVRLTYYCSVH
jgi:hypothetical protein